MSWESYREIYSNYELSVNQTRMVTIVAGEVLKDFPNNLPKNLHGSLIDGMKKFRDILDQYLNPSGMELNQEDLKATEKELTNSTESNSIMIENDLVIHMFKLIFSNVENLDSIDNMDFERLLYSQELVMLFAQLDAFMADSLRIICQSRPEILKSNKQLDYKTILSCDGWEELINHLSEEYVLEFGWKTINERLKFLRNKLNLNIEFSELELEFLKEAELIRHVIVHNGGKISQEYIKRSKEPDLIMGSFVDVNSGYIGELANKIGKLVSILFLAISKKFFNKEDADMNCIWRYDNSKS